MPKMQLSESTLILTRRDFLHLIKLAAGSTLLTPLLEACQGEFPPEANPTPSPAIQALLDTLQGRDIDGFIDQAYKDWLCRDPESLTTLGLSELLGVGNSQLTDVSDAFVRDTQSLERGLLDKLGNYDERSFTQPQAITTGIFDWFLDDLVRGHVFMYDDYPLNPIITSIHYNLYMLFTAYHPLRNRQDALDYIARLSQMEAKFDQLTDGLERRKENGVILPAFMIPIVINDLDPLATGLPNDHPFYKAFNERYEQSSLEEKSSLLEQVSLKIEESVIPAYKELVTCLQRLQKDASQSVGVSHFKDGKAFYAHCLRHHTTAESSAEEIHALGLEHVDRISKEMRSLFASLGYSSEEDFSSLFNRLAQESGILQDSQATSTYEQILHDSEGIISKAFDVFPRASVLVIGGTQGDYYLPPSFDGSRPGLFYVRTNSGRPLFGMKTLAFHETNPGHHFQLSVAGEQASLPAFRQGVQFNAYTEGWALYAERLMWELGAYDDDIQGNLGRLQMEAFRAARMVVDTGIHAMGWSFDKAVETMVEATGLPVGEVQGETVRYSVWPGQAASYYLGFLKLLELRQSASDALGNNFDLKTFHRIILLNGAAPFSILEKIVDTYINESKSI